MDFDYYNQENNGYSDNSQDTYGTYYSDYEDTENNYGTYYSDYEDTQDYSDNMPQFVSSFSDRNRTHVEDACNTMDIPKDMNISQFKKKIMLKEPKERLKQFISIICNEINATKLLNISSQDRNDMCREVENMDIKIAKFLNPTCFILSYIITEKGKIKDYTKSKSFKKIFDAIKSGNKLQDSSVKEEDVIRYCRFLNTL